MKTKILSLLLVLSALLTNHSFAQRSNGHLPIQFPIDLSIIKNYSIDLKVGDELVINVINPDKLYHSGDLENYNFEDDSDQDHMLSVTVESYSNIFHSVNDPSSLSLEKELNLNQETENYLVYHFKAIRAGSSHVRFGTPDGTTSSQETISNLVGPTITVVVSSNLLH